MKGIENFPTGLGRPAWCGMSSLHLLEQGTGPERKPFWRAVGSCLDSPWAVKLHDQGFFYDCLDIYLTHTSLCKGRIYWEGTGLSLIGGKS